MGELGGSGGFTDNPDEKNVENLKPSEQNEKVDFEKMSDEELLAKFEDPNSGLVGAYMDGSKEFKSRLESLTYQSQERIEADKWNMSVDEYRDYKDMQNAEEPNKKNNKEKHMEEKEEQMDKTDSSEDAQPFYAFDGEEDDGNGKMSEEGSEMKSEIVDVNEVKDNKDETKDYNELSEDNLMSGFDKGREYKETEKYSPERVSYIESETVRIEKDIDKIGEYNTHPEPDGIEGAKMESEERLRELKGLKEDLMKEKEMLNEEKPYDDNPSDNPIESAEWKKKENEVNRLAERIDHDIEQLTALHKQLSDYE